jgi:hypothetical protein
VLHEALPLFAGSTWRLTWVLDQAIASPLQIMTSAPTTTTIAADGVMYENYEPTHAPTPAAPPVPIARDALLMSTATPHAYVARCACVRARACLS